MITDTELNQIISDPRPSINDRFGPNHLLHYFGMVSDTPRYMLMEKERMNEIFDRAMKAGWCTDHHKKLIQIARKRIGK